MIKGDFCEESFSCECAPGVSSFCDSREVHLVSSSLNWGRRPLHSVCEVTNTVWLQIGAQEMLCLYRSLEADSVSAQVMGTHCPSRVAVPRLAVPTGTPCLGSHSSAALRAPLPSRLANEVSGLTFPQTYLFHLGIPGYWAIISRGP